MMLFKVLRGLGTLKLLNNYKKRNRLISIICLHRVSNKKNAFFPPMEVRVFDELMSYVKDHFQVIKPSQLYQLSGSDKPQLMITFDDGYKDFIDHALPVLKKYNLPCLHSIVFNCAENNEQIWTQVLNNILVRYQKLTGAEKKIRIKGSEIILSKDIRKLKKQIRPLFLKLLLTPKQERSVLLDAIKQQLEVEPEQEQMMNWEDIKVCLENDVEIASHTLSHDSLVSTQKEDILWEEIGKSKEAFEEKLGKNIDHFVLPNGQRNQHVINIAKKSGYKYLYLLDDKLQPMKSKAQIVSRVSIYHDSFIENQFKVESFHNLLKSPYRKYLK